MEAPIKNRRRAPCAKLSLPVRIRCFDSNRPEEIGRTSNVSREGLYFETSAIHYLEQYLHNWKARRKSAPLLRIWNNQNWGSDSELSLL